MEVILREHVDNLGRRGDVVKVAAGYARNYLLPRKLALAVNEGNKRQIERERKAAEARELEEKAQAEAYAQRLAQTDIAIAPPRRARTTRCTGRSRRPTSRRRSRQGFDIDKRKISWRSRSRRSARCTVPVKVHRDVTAQVKVKVVAEQEIRSGFRPTRRRSFA